MRSVFITGKLGKTIDQALKERFKMMEADAKVKGFTNFFYPVKLEDDCALNKEDAVKADILCMLSNADTLYLDSNWADSKRTMLLRNIAMRIGMDIVYHH